MSCLPIRGQYRPIRGLEIKSRAPGADHSFTTIFSCEDAALQVLMYVCPSVRLSPNLKIPSVCIPLECTRTEHYSLTLTSLYNIVQVCITLYKSVQHCTSMYKIVQVCTSMQLQKNACSYISLHAVT